MSPRDAHLSHLPLLGPWLWARRWINH